MRYLNFLLQQKKRNLLFNLEEISVSRELESNILASELLVNSSEGIELVLERGGILSIKETMFSNVSYLLNDMPRFFLILTS